MPQKLKNTSCKCEEVLLKSDHSDNINKSSLTGYNLLHSHLFEFLCGSNHLKFVKCGGP